MNKIVPGSFVSGVFNPVTPQQTTNKIVKRLTRQIALDFL